MQKNPEYICWFKDITLDDVPLVCGKNASLGEMYRELTPKGVKIPNDGVGLARMEFIFNNFIKIHPMALVHPEGIADESVKEKIDRLTFCYNNKKDYFVEKLAEGIGTIAIAGSVVRHQATILSSPNSWWGKGSIRFLSFPTR